MIIDMLPAGVNVSAENRGPGSQYINDRSGDQNVASGSGLVYKIDHQYNIHNWQETEAKEIPRLFHSFQSQLFNGTKYPQSPNSANIVDWLMRQPNEAPLNFQLHHNELLRQLARDTGRWILDTEEFLAWKDVSSPSRFMLMHGILGCGKSMLASLIINTFEKETKNGNDIACVYFYFQEGEEHKVSFARVWATLLVQLLRASGELNEEVKAKFDGSFQGSTRLHPPEYLELFNAQARMIKTVYIVIDALDNYQSTCEEPQEMQDALKTLPQNTRVLFTSKDNSFGLGVGTSRELHITLKRQDVENYVKKRIEDSQFLQLALKNDQARKTVVDKVTSMTISSKMFLSARLYMDELSKQRTVGDINKVLSQPRDREFDFLEASVKRIAQKIDQGNSDFEGCLARHILIWVIHAKTPLTTNEICDSFAVQRSDGQRYEEHRPEKAFLMPVCNGLVIMDPENETLNLVHKSVQTHSQKHHIIPGNANLEIAKVCLSYLLIDKYDQEGGSALLPYAAKHWWAHLDRKGQVDQETESLISKFLGDSSKLARAFRAIEGSDSNAFDKMTGLHAAVHFDLFSWAERLLKGGIDVNSQCSDGQTALHWAARYV